MIAKISRNKEYPHFVVVKRYDGDFMIVLDPNYGKYYISKEEFYSIWEEENGGYILVVIPKNRRLPVIFRNRHPTILQNL